jgi:8-oxoguanine deaminase
VGECTDELAWLSGQPNGFDALHISVRGNAFGPQPLGPQTTFFNWLDYLTQHALLPNPHRWVLAHGAVLTPAEWAQLATWQQQGHSIGVSHCLQSNLWLHRATIPNQHVQNALPLTGLLSLGTDSPLSSPTPRTTLDLRSEARALQSHQGLSSQQLLTLATQQGAQQLGLGNAIGQLTQGYCADMVLWHVPETLPCQTPQQAYEAWLHPDTTVAGVWIQGQRCPNLASPL